MFLNGWLVRHCLSQLLNSIRVKTEEQKTTARLTCVVYFHLHPQLSNSCSYAVRIITASLANNDNGAGDYRSPRTERRVGGPRGYG